MSTAESLLSDLEKRGAGALELAQYSSLATRIEPELLRALRINLLPDSTADIESTVWNSPIMEVRNPVAARLRHDVQALLRQSLAIRSRELDKTWRTLQRVHRHRPSTILLEERLVWLGLSGRIDDLRAQLQSIINTLLDQSRTGLAAWAVRAIQQLPDTSRQLEESRMLAFGASMRVDDHPRDLLKDVSVSDMASWKDWLKPQSVDTVSIGVRLLEDNTLEFGSPSLVHSHKLAVPRTFPLSLTVRWEDDDGAWTSKTCNVSSDRFTRVPIADHGAEIVTRLGKVYRVEKPPAASADENSRRNPKVHLTYDVERNGEVVQQELKFVMGVMGNFSALQDEKKLPLSDRRFFDIDRNNFDTVMAGISPRLEFVAEDILSVEGGQLEIDLEFQDMDSFTPAQIVNRIQPLSEKILQRNRLLRLLELLDSTPDLKGRFEKLFESDSPEKLLQAVIENINSGENGDVSLLQALVESASIEQSQAEELLINLANVVKQQSIAWNTDLSNNLRATATEIDFLLSEQLREIMHHEEFRRLEGSWRGLYFLVNNTDTGQNIKLRVLDVSKSELIEDVGNVEGVDVSSIFRLIYETEYGMAGGEPYGALIGDFSISNSPEDIGLLSGLAQISAQAFCPLITAASPELFGLDDFANLSEPRDLEKIFQSTEYADWRNFRDSDEAQFVVLTLPDVLARLPYGREYNPVESFDFEETNFEENGDVMNGIAGQLCWTSAAYAMGTVLTRSFAETGWFTKIRGIEGGGRVDGLPMFRYSADSADQSQITMTSFDITDRREAELSRLGFQPLLHIKNTDSSAFVSANSAHQPRKFDDPAATANAAISARLPYILVTSRIVQYIKCMVRDRIGSDKISDEVVADLQNWLNGYVNASPGMSPDMKARFPFAEVNVDLGDYSESMSSESTAQTQGFRGDEIAAILYLRPWLQMEELTASMLTVVRLPDPFGLE